MKPSWKVFCGLGGAFFVAPMVLALLPTDQGSGAVGHSVVGNPVGQPEVKVSVYPPNDLEVFDEGDSLLLRYRFDSEIGRKQFSCRIRKWADREVREAQALQICPQEDLVKTFAGKNGEVNVCKEDGRKDGRDISFIYSWDKIQGDPYSGCMWAKGFRCSVRACQRVECDRGECGGDCREKREWVLDYSRILTLSSPALQDCLGSLDAATGGNERILRSFILSMQYINPEEIKELDKELGRWTGDFRVPTAVLLQDEGDCDSKAALFSAVHRLHARRMVIFRSVYLPDDPSGQGHAMVGIEVPQEEEIEFPERERISGDWSLKWIEAKHYSALEPLHVGQRLYVPVDVTGSGFVEYGQVALDKRGEYMVIPIQPVDDRTATWDTPPAGIPCIHGGGSPGL